MASEFSEVRPPYWSDRPVIIVGSGSSLKGFDFNLLNGLGYILAVKEAIWDLPFADACFSLHLPWTKRRPAELTELASRITLYLAVPKGMSEKQYGSIIPRAIYIDRGNEKHLSDNPALIHAGGNSGFGALNLAYLKRAKSIYLFGFDFNRNGGHYCPERYEEPDSHNARYWENWGDNFINTKQQLAKAGISIINASPNSSIKAFPKATIEAALERLHWFRASRSASVRGSTSLDTSAASCADTNTRSNP